MRLCIGGETGTTCPALQVCAVCETCEEHCLSGGSGACVDAHDDWLAGGPGMAEVITSATPAVRPPFAPERAARTKVALLLSQDELAAENGLRRCAGCRGLVDQARPHRH